MQHGLLSLGEATRWLAQQSKIKCVLRYLPKLFTQGKGPCKTQIEVLASEVCWEVEATEVRFHRSFFSEGCMPGDTTASRKCSGRQAHAVCNRFTKSDAARQARVSLIDVVPHAVPPLPSRINISRFGIHEVS